jgi:SdrD B-like domain/PEP-CTERM motif
MSLHRLARRGHSILAVCVLALCTSNVAAHVPGTSQLGGWVYIDRNNDGQIAFVNDPNPEYVIGGVSISLFSKVGNAETFVSSMLTDANGRYLFQNINPGTYVLKQTQPVEFVDGIDTLGILQSLNGQPIPPTASPGFMSNNMFSNIVLTPDVGGEFYNFGERGLAAGYASKKFLFGSSPPPPPVVVPEPATLALAFVAAVGCWTVSRRRRVR